MKIIEPNYLAGSTLFHITHHGAALGSASLTSARLRLVGNTCEAELLV